MENIPQELKLAIQNVSNPQLVQQCEAMLNTYKNNDPNQLVSYLTVLLLCPDTILREPTSVLIRGIVNPNSKDGVWSKLRPEVVAHLKQVVLEGIRVETINHVRHKLVNITTAIAPELLSKNEWPELLPFIIESSRSPNENIRESAFSIIGSLATDILQAGAQLNHELFKQLVQLGLSDQSLLVQIAALGTISSFIDISPAYADGFKPLLPAMLKTIDNAMQSGQHEKQARTGIVTLLVIVEIKPDWIKHSFDAVFNQLNNYMQSEMAEEETRHHCVEFFITVAEKRPSLLKNQKYISVIIQTLLKWSSQIEEEDLHKWEGGEDLDEDPSSDAAFATDSLDRFAIHLGKAIFPELHKYLPQMASSANWNERFACLTAITMVSDGCKAQMKGHLQDLLTLILNLRKDPNIRVRAAVFTCLSQLATDYGVKLHQFASNILHCTLESLQDPCPRVLQSVCQFLSEFLEDISKELMGPNSTLLMQRLITLIQYPKIFVAQNALNAFSTIIDAIGADFKPFYGEIMPFLIRILQNENSRESRNFRGRAIETISLVGLAVGKETFYNDCVNVMKYLAEQPPFQPDDPQIDFSLRAHTRFCQCFGKDFAPYLNYAMKPLLEAVTQGFDVTTQPLGNGYEQDIIDENANRTLENKGLALYLIGIYAAELRDAFYPWVPQLIKPITELINFNYSEEVRSNCAALIPILLRVVKEYHDINDKSKTNTYLMELFIQLYYPLLKATQTEEEQIEVLSIKVKYIGECLEIVGPVSDEILKETALTYSEVFSSFKLYEQILADEQDEDDVDPEDHFETETLNDCFTDLAVSVGDFVIANKENSMKYITELMPTIFHHLEKSNDDIKASMLCILIDIVNNCGIPAYEMYQHIVPKFIEYAQSPNNAPQHTAVNGLGAAAESSPQHFQPYLLQTLEILNQIVANDKSRNKKHIETTESAIVALGKILQKFHGSLPQYIQPMIRVFLEFLPIQDQQEFPQSITSYLYLIENGYDTLILSTPDYIKKLITILLAGDKADTFTEEQKGKFKQIMRILYSNSKLQPVSSSFNQKADQDIIVKYLTQ
ncbi:importin subunit beta-3 [Tieghemostelium lacteum]|uniref:Importin subunit beta-3 n=1 Tax=Tieghemostelium lacteum TaxID=361077 RepID=A0A151ZEU4_TIELA|nr:importin subunit beta-3 [Tieghemostelium lacteum]|eukprot:KYQ92404.1 importin subunit beta-3 [Tieghemostelium lacteum]